MKSNDNRFIVISKEGSSLKNEGYRQILVDRETGVNYLVVHSGYGLAMTPLLDTNGKPIVSKMNDDTGI